MTLKPYPFTVTTNVKVNEHAEIMSATVSAIDACILLYRSPYLVDQ